MIINYNGAGWLQLQLDARHRMRPETQPERKLSALAVRVADLLGEWQRGIYHLDHQALYRADWSSETHIELTIYCSNWATYDFDELTRLVFLAHELAVRVSIEPATHRYMKMIFHPRDHAATGDARRWQWHPTIDEAIERIRKEHA